MGARRAITLVVLVTALGALPAIGFADTYPPQVDADEVVTGDATPPSTDVGGEQVVAPGTAETVDPAVAPAVDALSSTGAGVLPLVLVALMLLVVGGGLATLSQRRRTNTTL